MIANQIKSASISAVACFIIFVISCSAFGLMKSVFIIPVMILLPIVVYFQTKPKNYFRSPEAMMNEAPGVIGMFTTMISSGGSFDSAVRNIASTGPKHISQLFTKIVREADCRAIPDIRTGIKDILSTAPKELSSFRRAMLIVISAYESDNPERKMLMMKDAENTVLTGLKEMGEMYSARLNMPCMVVFSVGIMIPMILISVLPMLSIGGQFSTSLDTRAVAIITLVIVPLFVLGVILSLRGKNPFFSISLDVKDFAPLAVLLISVPIFFVLESEMGNDRAFLYSMILTGIISLAIVSYPYLMERKRKKIEAMLQDSLFELSNRLTMGENFDVALVRSLESRKDCKNLHISMKRELELCRGDIISAIDRIIRPISMQMFLSYADIYRASTKDIRNSGKLALSIAHQVQDQNSVRKGIELKLKNMLDMMTGTAAIFAPLILGMSIVMLGPISKISNVSAVEDIKPILMVYLVELSALITVLSSSLMCKGSITDIQWRFSLMMPISLIVFTVCCSFSI